jgi:hypothetical protein
VGDNDRVVRRVLLRIFVKRGAGSCSEEEEEEEEEEE